MFPILMIGILAAVAIAAASKAKATLPTIKFEEEVPKALPPEAEEIPEEEAAPEKPEEVLEAEAERIVPVKKKKKAKKKTKAVIPAVTPEEVPVEPLVAPEPVIAPEQEPAAVAKKKKKKKAAVEKKVVSEEEAPPTADQAAKALYLWCREGGNQGTKDNPSEFVARSQALLGFSGKDVDGIIGPKTRERVKEFGYTLPARAAQKPTAVVPEPILPEPALEEKASTVTEIETKKKKKRKKVIKATKTEKEQAVIEKLEETEVTAENPKAQEIVKQLVTTAMSDTASPELKTAAAQKIKEIVVQPTPAAKTEMIESFPAEAKQTVLTSIVEAEKETKPTPDQAAKALYLWCKEGGNQGTKTNRSAFVQKSQELLGFAGSDADGIVGPATRARVKEFGFTLAPRSAQKPGAVGSLGLNLRRATRDRADKYRSILARRTARKPGAVGYLGVNLRKVS